MPRVVVDTNVRVSGTLVAEGASAKILRAIRLERIRLVISPRILAEYEEIVQRRHIATKYPAVLKRADDLVNFIQANVDFVADVVENRKFVIADPNDDMVIACALNGKADYVVSGDQHLGALKEVEGIPILTPAEFVSRLEL